MILNNKILQICPLMIINCFSFFPFTNFEVSFKILILLFSNLNLKFQNFKIAVTYWQTCLEKNVAICLMNERSGLSNMAKFSFESVRKREKGTESAYVVCKMNKTILLLHYSLIKNIRLLSLFYILLH
jgi:hypothetical protein